MTPSRLPARLDLLQSLTGLLLALFMWLHMGFVASILLGADAFDWVAGALEGKLLFANGYPLLVSGAALGVLALFVVHAFLAMRKFPASARQYRTLHRHIGQMRHGDTTLWFVQVFTGFALFFLGSVHLYLMMTRPETIGAYGSSHRVVAEWVWPLYLLLLLAVELHGSIGLYRLAVKWGWLEGRDPATSRRRLRRAKWGVTLFFLTLGLASLAAFVKIGLSGSDHFGTPVPAALSSTAPLTHLTGAGS